MLMMAVVKVLDTVPKIVELFDSMNVIECYRREVVAAGAVHFVGFVSRARYRDPIPIWKPPLLVN